MSSETEGKDSPPREGSPGRTPLQRLRELTRTQWISIITVPILLLSAILAAHFDPPMRGWLFCIPYSLAFLFVLALFSRRAWGWLTTSREMGKEEVKEVDKALSLAIAQAVGITIAIFTLLQLINGWVDPLRIPEMFQSTPCSGNRATIHIDQRTRPTSDLRTLKVTITITKPPKDGEEYWIMTYGYSSTPMAFFAKEKLSGTLESLGVHSNIEIDLKTSDTNGRRDVFVACAWTPDAHAWLEENLNNDPNSAWNTYRRALHDGVAEVSDRQPDLG